MANNWQIDMIAGLEPNQSRAKINSQINKLKGQLKDISLTAKIDPKMASDIQKQLTNLQVSLTNVKISDKALNDMVSQINNALQGIKIHNINIGGNGSQQFINNITNGFKQSANAIEAFKNSLSNAGKSSSEIDNIVKKVQALNVQIDSLRFSESTNGAMNVNVAGLDEFGNKVRITQTLLQDLQTMQWNVTNTTTSVISTKELERINNTFADYTAKLAQFKSTNTNILSGLTQPLADFESKLAGLKNGTVSIDEVKNSYKLLGTEASKITENFTGQLSKTDAAIRKLAQGDEIMDKLKASFKGLNNAPKEITKELNSVSKLLQNVKKIESTEGRTANWSAEYRKWSDEVDKLQAKLSVLQKQQANMTTPQIFKTSELRNANIPYMTKVSNTIEKQIVEIQKMANAKGWQKFEVKGVEETDGKIKALTLTVRDAEGALKQFTMQRAKLQGSGKAQAGLMQVGDVKILETASQAQEKLAQSTDKANAKLAEQSNKIQLSYANGDYEAKVESTIAKTQQWVNANGEARISTTSLSTALSNLDKAYLAITADGGNTVANQKALKQAESELSAEIKKVTNDVTKMNATMAKSSTVDALRQKYQEFYDKNTAAHHKWGKSLLSAINELAPGAEVSKQRVQELNQQLINTSTAARQAGKLGLSFFDTIKQGMKTFSYWTSSTYIVMKTLTEIRQAVTTATELDTALVDLKKTTSMTSSQLEEFYYNSNDVAKQMGVTTKEIISQAAAFSRLGWSSAEAATQMAKFSSMFASISPGMNIDEATTDLTSIIKAYDVEVNDILDGILSKINIVGNTFGTSNAEIAEGLKLSSAAMASLGGSFEENVALFTAGQEIVQDASQVGNAIRSITMRIKGYDETTEEFSENVVEATGKVADLTKVASNNNMGISMFTDASQTHYKSLIEYLGEISDIWDEIDEKSQVDLLQNLFGKNRAQVGAAILQNFDTVRESLEAMENSAGNAEAEMSVIMDSIEYKANRLAETGTGIAQNLFNREDMKTVLDGLISIGEEIDFITDKLGMFGVIGLGAGLFAGIKNVGRLKMQSLIVLNCRQ